MNDPILITGCARSGTSMVAGCFNLCGAWGGEMSGPNKYNQKGMFENNDIREKCVKLYLKSIKVDPLGQWPLPDTNDMLIPVGWNEMVEDVIRSQGYEDGPWFYKGAKMCLMWPVWHVAFPRAKWIIVRRPDQDIINSCMRTGFMRAFKNAEGWSRWVEHHKRCFYEMHDAGLQIYEIWSDHLVNGNFEKLQEAIEWCGLDFDRKAVSEFISPELYHA